MFASLERPERLEQHVEWIAILIATWGTPILVEPPFGETEPVLRERRESEQEGTLLRRTLSQSSAHAVIQEVRRADS